VDQLNLRLGPVHITAAQKDRKYQTSQPHLPSFLPAQQPHYPVATAPCSQFPDCCPWHFGRDAQRIDSSRASRTPRGLGYATCHRRKVQHLARQPGVWGKAYIYDERRQAAAWHAQGAHARLQVASSALTEGISRSCNRSRWRLLCGGLDVR